MAHLRIWKFRPPVERTEDFEKAYGPDGVWPRLFRKGEGFLGTELLRPAGGSDWWVTIDRWRSLADFEAFQREHREAYERIDQELLGISGDEEFVGAFESS